MLAKAVANATTAKFISVVGSEFVQKYLGEVSLACFGVRETLASLTRPPCPMCFVSGTSYGTRCFPPCTGELAVYRLH